MTCASDASARQGPSPQSPDLVPVARRYVLQVRTPTAGGIVCVTRACGAPRAYALACERERRDTTDARARVSLCRVSYVCYPAPVLYSTCLSSVVSWGHRVCPDTLLWLWGRQQRDGCIQLGGVCRRAAPHSPRGAYIKGIALLS